MIARLPLTALRFLPGLAAALLVPAAPAFAQASPSAFTSAARYDGLGRVTGTIAPDPDGAGGLGYAAVRNSYDGAGRLTKVETGELAAWQSEAVAPGAWSGFTIFRTVEATYDGAGRRLTDSLREGAAGTIRTTTQDSYDADGRLECTAVRMNPAIFASLPASACTLGTAGSHGPDRITRNFYNAAGERVQLREGVGTPDEAAEATWAYNLNSQVTAVIDGNGNRAEYHYDAYGRQDRWTFPSIAGPPSYDPTSQVTALATAGSVNAADFEAYQYDPNGNRILLRKRDTSTLTYAYDALNRVTSKAPVRHGTIPLNGVHQRSVYYAYDLRGLQLAARFDSASGQGITNGYDGFGRLSSSSNSMGGITRQLQYVYDPNGNRTRITHPGGTFFRTDYDGLNRPTWLWANGATGMAYQGYYPHGGIAGRSLANGANSQWGYDAVQRLSAVIHGLAGTAHDATWTFGRNPAGQLSSQVRNNDAYAWTRHYGVARAYATNGLNQYIGTASTTASGPASTTFAYDRNGNLVSEGAIEYAYDVENRLVERSGGTVLTYDPLGRLFSLANNGATTTFLYDGDALVGEYNSAGAMTRRYVHNVGADVPLLSYEGANLSLPSYLHADHQGSIVAVSDPWGAGSVNTYDEYGIPGVANVGRFQYTGQIWLPEIGMYHYKARVYSPTLGRFLQTDPVGYEGGVNLYGYVGDDPVNATDPDGQIPLVVPLIVSCASNPWCAGLVGGGLGLVIDRLRPSAPTAVRPTPTPTPAPNNSADQDQPALPAPLPATQEYPGGYTIRVQAQGTGLRSQRSQVIQRARPIKLGEVLNAIEGVVAALPRRERRSMQGAAENASEFAINVASQGGVNAPVSRNFGNGVDSRNRFRVDIEVIRGRRKQIVE